MVAVNETVERLLKLDERLKYIERDVGERNGSGLDKASRRLEDLEGDSLTEADAQADRFDARLEASEARTDAKFADLRGDFAALRGEMAAINANLATTRGELREELITSRADNREANAGLRAEVALLLAEASKATGEMRGELQGLRAVVDAKPNRIDIWGAALAVAALGMAVLAFASDRQAIGLSLADKRQEQLQRDSAQDNAVIAIGNKIDALKPAVADENVRPVQERPR